MIILECTKTVICFFILCFYLLFVYILPLEIQLSRCFKTATCVCLSQGLRGFPMLYILLLLLIRYVIVNFVDISETDDLQLFKQIVSKMVNVGV